MVDKQTVEINIQRIWIWDKNVCLQYTTQDSGTIIHTHSEIYTDLGIFLLNIWEAEKTKLKKLRVKFVNLQIDKLNSDSHSVTKENNEKLSI